MPKISKQPKAPRQLNLRELDLFVCATKHDNLTEAAKERGLSVGAFSEAISSLEADLGDDVKLFDRGQHGATLTQAGWALSTRADAILSGVADARAAVLRSAQAPVESLKIVFQPSLAAVVRASLETLLRKMPHLRVEAAEYAWGNIIKRLGGDEAALALAYLPADFKDLPDGVKTEVIQDSSIWFTASNRHALARVEQGERIALDSLVNEPFAVPWLPGEDDSWIRKKIAGYFSASDSFIPQNIVLQSNRVSAVLAVVRAGLAVSVLPTLDPIERHGLAIRALSPKPPNQEAGFLWKREHPWSAAEKAFADEVRRRM